MNEQISLESQSDTPREGETRTPFGVRGELSHFSPIHIGDILIEIGEVRFLRGPVGLEAPSRFGHFGPQLSGQEIGEGDRDEDQI